MSTKARRLGKLYSCLGEGRFEGKARHMSRPSAFRNPPCSTKFFSALYQHIYALRRIIVFIYTCFGTLSARNFIVMFLSLVATTTCSSAPIVLAAFWIKDVPVKPCTGTSTASQDAPLNLPQTFGHSSSILDRDLCWPSC